MSLRDKVVDFLYHEVEEGITEYPPGSNQVKYNDWFYERPHAYYNDSRPYAWCGAFVAYILHYSDVYVEEEIHKALVYVPSAQNVLNRKGKRTENPRPGDVVIFDWNSDGFEEHIGFFVGMENGKALCIEGNTSPDEKGSQSNGGAVCLKRRSLSLIEGFYNLIGDEE